MKDALGFPRAPALLSRSKSREEVGNLLEKECFIVGMLPFLFKNYIRDLGINTKKTGFFAMFEGSKEVFWKTSGF